MGVGFFSASGGRAGCSVTRARAVLMRKALPAVRARALTTTVPANLILSQSMAFMAPWARETEVPAMAAPLAAARAPVAIEVESAGGAATAGMVERPRAM